MSRSTLLIISVITLSIVCLAIVFHTRMAPIGEPVGQFMALGAFLALVLATYVAIYSEINKSCDIRTVYWQDHVFLSLFYFVLPAAFLAIIALLDNFFWLLLAIIFFGPGFNTSAKVLRSYLGWVRRLYAPDPNGSLS